MKVLVFGKTGQVARALIAAGSEHGLTIAALGRDEADLSDPQACADRIAASHADAVINAAAWTAVDAAEEEEDAAFVINAEAPGAMARACAAKDIPFVHISTDYVFDGSEGAAWLPTDPTHPLGAYGRTKLTGEQQVTVAGGTSVILRTAWVFDGTGKNFVTTMLRLSETRDTLTIVADQNGGPTPAAAIADACLRIAKDLAAGYGKTGIYHFSGAPDTTWADFARAVFATAGRDVTVQDIATADYPTPAKRPANSRLDCTSLETDYGIRRPDWQAALTEILAERSTS
ncbi:dTDP-4-dehydrorhamnose reductase [Cognatiyoonia sp. IB215182]|uniref:dTDP-4-dehydrorhamnose reductase n=1 Tax=Cognatiyoonia sp. IB215182 TaxID=3097353 RepID=UPI002A0DA0AB|nr:dTDP-4-dehydrorhamnose reductase [Cognatiyoonia sp. IB215182]MDX8353091.1 dTDP-4-dehydrorhamnose reductase [Cognatiyoonia sp. IB215182]